MLLNLLILFLFLFITVTCNHFKGAKSSFLDQYVTVDFDNMDDDDFVS